MTAPDDEETSLIVTKRGSYIVARKLAITWEQRFPGRSLTPPAGFEDHKFWPTPEGWVFARPDLSGD